MEPHQRYEIPDMSEYRPGRTVRQYHDCTRLRYDEAEIVQSDPCGALLVKAPDGTMYGWSARVCEVRGN